VYKGAYKQPSAVMYTTDGPVPVALLMVCL